MSGVELKKTNKTKRKLFPETFQLCVCRKEGKRKGEKERERERGEKGRWVAGREQRRKREEGSCVETGFYVEAKSKISNILISEVTVKESDKERKTLTAVAYPKKGGVSNP